MFTGIITNIGTIREKTSDTLTIETSAGLLGLVTPGLSISVNGICLTVVEFNTETFSVNFMPETAKVTNLNSLQKGDPVNLELPATPKTFLAGHVVQGHVDCVGTIEEIEKEGNSLLFKFGIPSSAAKYIVKKGSIAVNGISLTVINTGENYFSVGIIPHTLDHTMLQKAKKGDLVNIELDVLAKYLEKLIKSG